MTGYLKKTKWLLIVCSVIFVLVVLYTASYPLILISTEKISPSVGYVLCEPLECLRNNWIWYWKLTERAYRKLNGQTPVGKRYYFNSHRYDYVFDKNGNIAESVELRDGKWSGAWSFHKSGRFYKMDFLNGVPNGTYLVTYPQPDMDKISKIYFISLGFIEKEINFYKNRNLMTQVHYSDVSDLFEKTISNYTAYYPNKDLQKKLEYLFDHGAYTQASCWNDDGTMVTTGTFKENQAFQGTFKIDAELRLYVKDGIPIQLESLSGNFITSEASELQKLKERYDVFHKKILCDLNDSARETEEFFMSLIEASAKSELMR